MTTCPNYAEQAAVEWNLDKLYLDLAKAKENIDPDRTRGLTPTEMLHLQGLLSGYSPLDIANQLVIKPEGLNVALSKTIYRYIENLTEHPPHSIKNWREVVEWLDAARYRKIATIDWGEAPDFTTFHGRKPELSQLTQWILSNQCRLVALLGMGGIGKTALATVLVEQIKDKFEWVVWRSLRAGPSLAKLLPELLPEHTKEQDPLSKVMQYVREHRCLIILDEFESVLTDHPVGHYREGYENYGEFLRRIGTERHQSCVFLTSREQPKESVLLEDRTYSLQLGSLGEASQQILQDKKLLDENHQWHKVTQLYAGNPLALKLVADIIKYHHDGSIFDFLKNNTSYISNELSETLDQQFTRLSKPETEVVRQLAIHSQPVSISILREAILQIDSCINPIQVIEALRRRSLLEKIKSPSEPFFTLHPIVLKYVKRKYIEKI
jgi:NB-ARC domain